MSGAGRVEALKAALAALPAADAPYEKKYPLLKQVGPDEYEYMGFDYDPRIDDLFKTFRSGAFGFSEEDGDYFSSLDRRRQFEGELRVEAFGALDRETCLLWLRFFDRQERFGEGLRAGVHRAGVLHALVERLIAIEGGQDVGRVR